MYVTEEPVGGRILVVAPKGDQRSDDRDGSFVHGGDASPTNSEGRADNADHPGEGESDSHKNWCRPREVAAEISDQLPVEVVVKDERTAPEYLDELGPTLDCVVVLGAETEPLGAPVDDGSVPAVVYEVPVIDPESSTTPDAVTVDEVAARVQLAVRDARLRSDLQDKNTRLTALNRYARDITACETVDAVLERTVEAATDALAFDYCVILLVDGDRFVSRASVLPDPDLSPFDITDGIAGRTLAAGESEIVADMQSDPDAVVQHDDLRGLLSVPIGSEGVLQIVSRERDAFGERDREFAEILSGYTSEALARLEREAGLRAERDRLNALYADLPAPAICVERQNGEIVVASTNAAYESVFGTVPARRPLSNVNCTEAEYESYESALCTDEPTQVAVTRSGVDGSDREYTLTLIPTSPPGVVDSVFGVYRAK